MIMQRIRAQALSRGALGLGAENKINQIRDISAMTH
jgi:hypothetical protein